MIVRPEIDFLVDTESVCFAQKYRCNHCGSVVSGVVLEDGSCECEKCATELFEDDEVVIRIDTGN